MMRKMMNAVRRMIAEKRLKDRILRERFVEERIVLAHVEKGDFDPLTEDEQRQVQSLWGQLVPDISFKEYEVYKRHFGFNPKMLSHQIYLPLVARRINDYSLTLMYDNKGYYGGVLKSHIKFIPCYFRVIKDEFYADDMRQLTKSEALEIAVAHDEVVLKRSVETSGGKSFKKIVFHNEDPDERVRILDSIIKSYGDNYVCQESLKQCEVMSKFNASSINTIRITTLYLNGKFSVLSIVIRAGGKGSEVDNLSSGGMMIGVSNEGFLLGFGVTDNYKRKRKHNGLKLDGIKLDFIPEVIKRLEDAHIHDFSLSKFIGWDIMIDINGEPIIVEVNASQPGVRGIQYCTGPVFGDRTQEVIDYCKSKKFHF